MIPLEFGSSGRIAVMSLCPCCREGEELGTLSDGGSTVSSSGAVHVLRETRWDPCLSVGLVSV